MPASYRDLLIYRKSHELGVELHAFSLKLPNYEMYESGSQLRRACKSVSANIVEGFGRRRYKADFVRFLVYAQASCDETLEWLTYISECHEKLFDLSKRYMERIEELGKMVNGFIQSVEKSHLTNKK